MLFRKKIKIVTHSGNFHSDDLFAVATLELFLKRSVKVIRTRDPKVIEKADYVVDVGGIYDASKKRFDHHQFGGAGVRANGIPYASFGLVWKELGEKLTDSKEIADSIDLKLVAPTDAGDNGVSVYSQNFEGIDPYLLNDYFNSFRPTWKEKKENFDEVFLKLLPVARKLLSREIERAKSKLEAKILVEEDYKKSDDKRVVVLSGEYPWREFLQKFPEPLFVVHEDKNENTWKINGVPVLNGGFKLRKDLPEVWAGKRDGELAEVTGVPDAVFCHNKRFLAIAKSKEGILQLAQMALKS